MKKLIIQTLIVSAITLSFLSCKKIDCIDHITDKCKLIPAKILRYDCDRIIFELKTDQKIGDENWTNSSTGQTHHNVVACFNTCPVSEITKGKMVTVYVKLKETEQFFTNEACVTCPAVSTNVPDKQVDFLEIKSEPFQCKK